MVLDTLAGKKLNILLKFKRADFHLFIYLFSNHDVNTM